MSYQHQQKQRRRRSAKKRENRKHQKQRSRMLATRHTQPALPKAKDVIEKTMDKSEVIESLAIFFYNSIQKNEKSRRRRPVFRTAPTIFNGTDFRAISPTISDIRTLIETIFEKRRLAAESGVIALVLFSRAGVKMNSSNWMRIILIILLLANKEAEDVYSVWNVRFVGIIPNLPVYEINLLELEFLKYLKYRLHVEKPTYEKFYKQLVVLLPEKTSEEKVEQSAENFVEESAENFVEESAENFVEDSAENSVEDSAENLEKEDEERSEQILSEDQENLVDVSHISDDEFKQFKDISEEIIISDVTNIKVSDRTCPERHTLRLNRFSRNMSHAESIP